MACSEYRWRRLTRRCDDNLQSLLIAGLGSLLEVMRHECLKHGRPACACVQSVIMPEKLQHVSLHHEASSHVQGSASKVAANLMEEIVN